jgi:hypothetical protein
MCSTGPTTDGGKAAVAAPATEAAAASGKVSASEREGFHRP